MSDLSDLGFEPEEKVNDFSDLGFEPEITEGRTPSATQSSEETNPLEFKSDQYSTLEAAGIHGLDSLLFGLSDELKGALTSPSGAAKTIGQLIGLKEGEDADTLAYKKSRDVLRDIQRITQEESPYASFAGSLAGGVLPGTAIAKGVNAATKGALASGELVKQMANTGLQGIVGGAAYGTGLSEKDTVSGIAEDSAKGAALGGVIGGIIPPVGKVAGSALRGTKNLGKFISELGPIEKGIEGFKRGDVGKSLFNLKKQFKDELEAVEKVVGVSLEHKKALQKEYDVLISEMEKVTNKTDLAPFLKKADDLLTQLENIRDKEVYDQVQVIRKKLSEFVDGFEKSPAVKSGREQAEEVLKQAKLKEKHGAADRAMYEIAEDIDPTTGEKILVPKRFVNIPEETTERMVVPREVVPGDPTSSTKVRGQFESSPEGKSKAQTMLEKLTSKAKTEKTGKTYELVDDLEDGYYKVVETSQKPGKSIIQEGAPTLEKDGASLAAIQKPEPLAFIPDTPGQPAQRVEGVGSAATPKDLFELQKLTGKLNYAEKPLDTRVSGVVKNIDEEATTLAQKTTPKLEDLTSKYKALKQGLDNLGLDGGDILRPDYLKGTMEVSPDVISKLTSTIRGLEGNNRESALRQLTLAFHNLEKSGVKGAVEMLKNLEQIAKDFDLTGYVAGEGSGTQQIVNWAAAKAPAQIGNVLGLLKKGTRDLVAPVTKPLEKVGAKVVKPPYEVARDLVKFNKESLDNLAMKAELRGEVGQKLGKILRSIGETSDQAKRNALTFSILQQHDYRTTLNEIFNDEDNAKFKVE